jgi:hypothetical protein
MNEHSQRPASPLSHLWYVWAAAVMIAVLSLAMSARAFGAAPEAPTTSEAKAVTATTATLGAVLSPHGEAPAEYKINYRFIYTRSGDCAEEGGVTNLGFAEEKHVKKGTAASMEVTKLEASSEYGVCAAAVHKEGEELLQALGNEVKLKTLASKPLVESDESSGVTPFAATVGARVNPENAPTEICLFEYTPEGGATKTAACEQSLGGAESEPASAQLTGLTPSKAYSWHIVVKDASGTTTGVVQHFTTLKAESPIVSEGSESASSVSTTEVELHATLNPDYQETTFGFEFSTNRATLEKHEGEVAHGATPLEAEFAELPVSTALAHLAAKTTYYYRVVASNGTGASSGAIAEFTTHDSPAVVTGEATGIERAGATVSGSVDPNGVAAWYYVVYVPSAQYEPGAENPFSQGLTTQQVLMEASFETTPVGPIELLELAPQTTYDYALVATSTEGTTIGPVRTFTTSALTPPSILAEEAAATSQTAADIYGTVNTSGLPTAVQFELRRVGVEAVSEVPATPEGGEGSQLRFSAGFQSLAAGTSFEYRLVARNADGVAIGAWNAFTTPAFPSAFPAPESFPLLTSPGAEAPNSPPPVTKTLTNSEKLAKALVQCRKKHHRRKQRLSCERKARKEFPVKKA